MEVSCGELQRGFQGRNRPASWPHQPTGHLLLSPSSSGSSRWLFQLIGSEGGPLLPLSSSSPPRPRKGFSFCLIKMALTNNSI